MNTNDFKKALEFTLSWEGEYSNESGDSGGVTKWGIASKYYPQVKNKDFTKEEALQIYQADYWSASGCDSLSYPMNLVVFDSAVNCGVGRAKEWAKGVTDPEVVIAKRKDYYVDLVRKNPTLRKFLRGWAWRIIDLQKLVIIWKQEQS